MEIGYHCKYWYGWSVSVSAGETVPHVLSNIGGSTLHSWAGIGLGDDPVGAAVAKIRAKKLALRRWLETKTLLVDESVYSA